MYKLLSEAVDTALALKPLVGNANHCDVVIAPVFTALKTIAARLEGSNVMVAAQNCAGIERDQRGAVARHNRLHNRTPRAPFVRRV